MAYWRIILCTVLVVTCYFVGVTWAEKASSVSSSSITNNSNNNHAAEPQIVPPVAADDSSAIKTLNALVTPTNHTAPNCVCNGALLPRLSENGKELEICPDCKCKHEARNTTLTKVVVIIVIWIISILVIYMLFLMCLDPLLNKRVKANYQEHTNEDEDATSSSPPLPSMGNQEINARANVLNRVGHQQNKWKRQVREQRRHIYDRRTMLN